MESAIQNRSFGAQVLPVVILMILTLSANPSIRAQPVYSSAETFGPPMEDPPGTILGRVVDQESGEPVALTTVLIVETNQWEYAHEDGSFHFFNIPEGSYTLFASRIGYHPQRIEKLHFKSGDTLHLLIKMESGTLKTHEVTVEADAIRNKTGGVETVLSLSGKTLRQHLGRTIAETLDNEPGLDQRTMGPAPARPVLRGLGGDRLLLLEDGERTGDLSATSSDHAVVIDPITANRIEVIRGPASLMYGPNTLGGVINVVRDYVPAHLPHRFSGSASAQGETVNTGYSAGATCTVPLANIAMGIDGSRRDADDIGTPAGVLHNTFIETNSISAGAALFESFGRAGIAWGIYESEYGIPGGFIGAHPNGVNISIEKRHLEVKTDVIPGSSWIRKVSAHVYYTRYYHAEIESGDLLGAEFGVLTWNGKATAFLEPGGFIKRGTAGVWTEYRDYAAGGFVFTPATDENTIAGFMTAETNIGDIVFEAALRYDYRVVTPKEETTSGKIGAIATRTFGDVSAALHAKYRFAANLVAGIQMTRTFRAPVLEELYSEGPHLAAYSFEVGNPALDPEHGLGVELSLHYEPDPVDVQMALYSNRIDGYIFPRNTGEINFRTLLPVYRYTGGNALMNGAEIGLDVRLSENLSSGFTMSYVHGTLTDLDFPLPMMPPLTGKLSLRYSAGDLGIGLSMRGCARQDRVDEFEEPTAGYFAFGMSANYSLSSGPLLHTFQLAVENLTDSEYRKHLSRVKSVLPEPGRNFKLLYRVYF